MHGCMAYDMMIRSSAGPRGKQGVHFRNLVFCRKPCCHKHDRLLFCLKCFVCLPVILYWTGIHVNRLWKLSTSFQRSTCMCQHESGQQKLCDCCWEQHLFARFYSIALGFQCDIQKFARRAAAWNPQQLLVRKRVNECWFWLLPTSDVCLI